MKIGLWRIKGYLFIYSLHRYLLPEKFPGDECHQPKVTKMTKAVTCFTFSGSGSTLFPLSYKTPQIQLLHREWLFKTIVCLSGLLHLWGDSQLWLSITHGESKPDRSQNSNRPKVTKPKSRPQSFPGRGCSLTSMSGWYWPDDLQANFSFSRQEDSTVSWTSWESH